ncbi:hypothetical protein B0T10DRAFT_610074 [Thelonectria olida]|uniref:Uncharacterized protein n=1 Tax=Thelonectria olida TaxID=1576542 RepID=A0A9P8VTN9_9HYPO|nr:hypothetical protein B0T10DRAFT_610074 [Thelonectria olida]
MPSSVVTSLLLPGYRGTLVAKVIGAEATATTYVLNCGTSTDDIDCGVYNNSITLGPWASKTLPPGAAKTGEFDLFITQSYAEESWKFSVHCDMTRSVAEECTTINIGGNDDGHPTATITESDYLDMLGFASFTWVPVTITAGQDLLTATHSASDEASATGDTSDSAQATSGDATATGAKASSSETSTTEGSSSTPSPDKDSGAATFLIRTFTAMSVAGLAVSIVLS